MRAAVAPAFVVAGGSALRRGVLHRGVHPVVSRAGKRVFVSGASQSEGGAGAPLADGSARVRVTLADGATIELREIRGRIRTREGARTAVRLWTSLTDARRHPARKLLRLYARRWEQEVATDELKNRLHRGALLQSQTVRTAVQELTALVLAQALVARVRTAAARRGRVPTLRVSFGKTLQMLQVLWPVLEVSEGLLSRRQQAELIRRMEERLLRKLTGPRRARTYPRAVRQPVTKWPRLHRNEYQQGSIEVEVTRIKK